MASACFTAVPVKEASVGVEFEFELIDVEQGAGRPVVDRDEGFERRPLPLVLTLGSELLPRLDPC